MSAPWIYRDESEHVTFVYRGGPYIDIFWSDAFAARGLDSDEPAVPFANTNVWDYELSESNVHTRAEFAQVCETWIGENRDDLGGYLEHSS